MPVAIKLRADRKLIGQDDPPRRRSRSGGGGGSSSRPKTKEQVFLERVRAENIVNSQGQIRPDRLADYRRLFEQIVKKGQDPAPRTVVAGRPDIPQEAAEEIAKVVKRVGRVEIRDQETARGKEILIKQSTQEAIRRRVELARDLERRGIRPEDLVGRVESREEKIQRILIEAQKKADPAGLITRKTTTIRTSPETAVEFTQTRVPTDFSAEVVQPTLTDRAVFLLGKNILGDPSFKGKTVQDVANVNVRLFGGKTGFGKTISDVQKRAELAAVDPVTKVGIKFFGGAAKEIVRDPIVTPLLVGAGAAIGIILGGAAKLAAPAIKVAEKVPLASQAIKGVQAGAKVAVGGFFVGSAALSVALSKKPFETAGAVAAEFGAFGFGLGKTLPVAPKTTARVKVPKIRDVFAEARFKKFEKKFLGKLTTDVTGTKVAKGFRIRGQPVEAVDILGVQGFGRGVVDIRVRFGKPEFIPSVELPSARAKTFFGFETVRGSPEQIIKPKLKPKAKEPFIPFEKRDVTIPEPPIVRTTGVSVLTRSQARDLLGGTRTGRGFIEPFRSDAPFELIRGTGEIRIIEPSPKPFTKGKVKKPSSIISPFRELTSGRILQGGRILPSGRILESPFKFFIRKVPVPRKGKTITFKDLFIKKDPVKALGKAQADKFAKFRESLGKDTRFGKFGEGLAKAVDKTSKFREKVEGVSPLGKFGKKLETAIAKKFKAKEVSKFLVKKRKELKRIEIKSFFPPEKIKKPIKKRIFKITDIIKEKPISAEEVKVGKGLVAVQLLKTKTVSIQKKKKFKRLALASAVVTEQVFAPSLALAKGQSLEQILKQKLKARQEVRIVEKAKSIQETLSKARIASLSKISSRVDTVSKIATAQKFVQAQKVTQDQKFKTTTEQIIAQKTRIDITQAIRSKTRTQTIQDLIRSRPSITRITIKKPPITTSIKPFLPSRGEEKKSARPSALFEKVKSFAVLLKIKGKFEKIGEGFTRAAALDVGTEQVKARLAATFKIREVKGKPTKLRTTGAFLRFREELRGFQIKKGQRIQLKDTFIQKRGTRLGTRSEVGLIQRSRRLKL